MHQVLRAVRKLTRGEGRGVGGAGEGAACSLTKGGTDSVHRTNDKNPTVPELFRDVNVVVITTSDHKRTNETSRERPRKHRLSGGGIICTFNNLAAAVKGCRKKTKMAADSTKASRPLPGSVFGRCCHREENHNHNL